MADSDYRRQDRARRHLGSNEEEFASICRELRTCGCLSTASCLALVGLPLEARTELLFVLLETGLLGHEHLEILAQGGEEAAFPLTTWPQARSSLLETSGVDWKLCLARAAYRSLPGERPLERITPLGEHEWFELLSELEDSLPCDFPADLPQIGTLEDLLDAIDLSAIAMPDIAESPRLAERFVRELYLWLLRDNPQVP